MTSPDFGSVALALMLVIGAANLAGHAFVLMRQPRIIGEILAGILIGPMLLGRLVPSVGELFGSDGSGSAGVLAFLYQLGLLLLMLVSGAATHRILAKENRRPTLWLLTVGTALPFVVGLGLSRFVPLESLSGPHGVPASLALVFAIAVSVTSIPVISHIFNSLGIIRTRFASLVLGVAVLEDIVLWAVLAFAAALSAGATHGSTGETISVHVGVTVAYLAAGLIAMPPLLRRASAHRWNMLARHSPIAWIMTVLFAYVGVASVLDVTLPFAGFLAGFGIVGGVKATERSRFAEPLDLIGRFSFATFIPVYTCIVGYRLDFTREFSLLMLVVFLVGSTLLRLASVGVASYLGGFRGREILNLAVTCNARGGPGIVLASVAFDAGIINAPFFTSLVVTAILTSQLAGSWLAHVVRQGWPLLNNDSDLRRQSETLEGITDEDQDPVHAGAVVVAAGSHRGA
jgi:Kef-type K+ transport system membrane component KefB